MSKFNKGDKVVCVDAGMYPLTEGHVYEVLSDNGAYVSVTDDRGRNAVCYRRRFEKAPDAGIFILILRNPDGTFAPAVKPRTYATQKQADAVALEMANKHGGDFVVFRATSVGSRPPAPAATLTAI